MKQTLLLLLALLASPVWADPINPLDNRQGATVPAFRISAVTPSDSYVFGVINRGIWVGTGGNLAVLTSGGDRVTIVNVQGGTLLPLIVQSILATGTTASDIEIWW